MTLVTRYLLVSRVESEANNDLRSSFLGSDNISGLYKSSLWWLSVRFRANTLMELLKSRILRWIGVMSAFKESDLRSAMRFPSQENSLESVR